MQQTDRYKDVYARLVRAKADHASAHMRVAELNDEIDALSAEYDIRMKSSQVLRQLLTDTTRENLESIDKLVTEGLQTVFHDQKDIEFRSKMVEKLDQIHIQFETVQGDAEGKASESFGASVTVVESFLLRIVIVLRMGLAPVLLLDESFAQVSEHYIEPLGKLLKRLCRDLGLRILLVTHKTGFIESADTVYKVSSVEEGDVRTLKIQKVKDRSDDSPTSM
tara:strand:+ start:993 stop:1658 length:666 start_codon:yes stop_codon:yes gene_type:complete